MKRWRWGIAVAILMALGLTGYYGYTRVVAAAPKTENSYQQVKVERGTLIETVSAQGSIDLPEQKDLGFGTAGTLHQLLVKQGDTVKKGQVLARLDPASISQLAKAIAQAQLNLKDAEKRLDDAKAPYDEADIARAELAVANAQLAVQKAQEGLDKALDPYAQDEVAKAEVAVTTARLAAQAAQEAFDKSKSPYSSEEVVKAQAQLTASLFTIVDDQRALSSTKSSWESKLAAIQEKVKDSETKYIEAFTGYFGMKLSETQLQRSPDILMKEAQIDLPTLFKKDILYPHYDLEGVQKTLNHIASKTSPQVDPLAVYAWVYLAPPGASDVEAIEKDIKNRWEVLRDIRDQLSTSRTQADLAIANAENKIAADADAIRVAKERLDDLKKGADPLEVAAKERQLALAQATIKKAEEDLAKIKKGADRVVVEAQKRQLYLAKANVKKAEEDLAEVREGADSVLVALREAEVAAVKAALAEAQANLAAAEMKAPFDGIVAITNIEEGKQVGANAAVLRLVDPSKTEIDLSIDEMDIAKIRTTQPATFTLDALPNRQFVGLVASIAPIGRQQSGVVSYPVTVSVVRGDGSSQGERLGRQNPASGQRPEGISPSAARGQRPEGTTANPRLAAAELPQLAMGMSALVNIVVERKENVLLVPSRAIRGNSQRRYVEVVTPTGLEERTVRIGTSDGQRTEVTEGLQEGEEVAVRSSQAVQTNIRLGGFGGGGFGGPGFAPPQAQPAGGGRR